jgi:hypothetical protein
LDPKEGMLHAPGRNISGMNLIRRSWVTAFFVRHGTDNRDVLHLLRDERKIVGDANAGDACRNRFRRTTILVSSFRIERFELAWATLHPEQDHRFALFL